ncbi:hypothetical protein GCM10023084_73860 [Streptomyces lacrimifluminis]|uniref:Uncharacterized protein n=1 Tax=Streptomyces lacrimifluminis TaxID=1500077 RepID=A0A917P6Z2_9ACTN|nr:hypothetical protein GCM10012282_72220 [Streptomyces lacrimifluminis]
MPERRGPALGSAGAAAQFGERSAGAQPSAAALARPGLLADSLAVPRECLAGDGGDALEVPVAVQRSEPLQLGCGGPTISKPRPCAT